MYGISEKGLFEAPPSNLASWTAPGEQRDIMAWKRYDEAITQLKDFVLQKTNDFARLNHVGAAFVSEQLVEVRQAWRPEMIDPNKAKHATAISTAGPCTGYIQLQRACRLRIYRGRQTPVWLYVARLSEHK